MIGGKSPVGWVGRSPLVWSCVYIFAAFQLWRRDRDCATRLHRDPFRRRLAISLAIAPWGDEGAQSSARGPPPPPPTPTKKPPKSTGLISPLWASGYPIDLVRKEERNVLLIDKSY